MLKIFSYILFIFLIVGCSQKKDEIPAPTISIPALVSLNGGSIRLTTSDSPQLVESPIILTDDGKKIPDGTQFRLVSDVIKINTVNSLDDLTWKTSLIVNSLEGKFSFYVKPYTVTGLYRVNAYPVENTNIKFDQGLNARYFINIVAGLPSSLGEIKTDYYQDKPNFNNMKDANEKWIVTANPDLISNIAVGPISDSYNNLIEEGQILLTSSDGQILSENPTKILAGYAYYSYKASGTIGNINLSATITNHPLNSNLSTSSSILSASPQLQLMESPNFAGMTVNSTKCETVRLINNGAMSSTQLNFESTFPFLLVDENTNDSLCPLTSDVCKLNQTLRSGEICKLRIKLTMPNNSLSDGDLTIQVNPQEFASSLIIQKLRTQSVQAAQLISSNPFISFGGTQCSTNRVVDIVVENIGDFDATGIVVQNPPPNNNQSNPFYSIILPPVDIPMNSNKSSIVNCGTTFPSGRKCRVKVNFNPTAGILNQALIGKILGTNINPLILSVSGYTIPGNGLSTFPISFVTPNNSLLPLGMFIGNGQQTRVDVGPVVDACNQRVADGTILTSTVSAGNLAQSTLVTNNGYSSFYWNAGTDISKIGSQSIDISVGVNGSKSGSILFRGVNLQLTGATAFNQVIQGKPKELTITLTNSGNINAQNLSFNIGSPLVITDSGTCASGQLNLGSSCQIKVKADPQNINQDLNIPLVVSSSSLGANSVTTNFSLNARTKPILKFDYSNYLFNDGISKSVYSRDIILTNQGPAISYDTVISVESPFIIGSSNCTSTLNVNQSCTITVNLNNTDAAIAVDKKISVSNEVEIDSPFAILGFSSLQFNQSNLLGIVDRCFGPYSVSIKGSTGVITSVSSNTVNLSSGGGGIVFYNNALCNTGTEITTTVVSGGSSVSSLFYIKSSQVSSNNLVASHPSISSGFLGVQFNSELNLNVPVPNALVSNETLPLVPSGGYGTYSIGFVDGTQASTYSDLIAELDSNSEPTGNKSLFIKTITGSKFSIVRVTDVQGFYKDFTFNLYQLPTLTTSSLTARNSTPVSILPLINDYGNPNVKNLSIQRFVSPSYISGSLYGSSINGLNQYIIGNSIPNNTTEYVLISIPKFTGGSLDFRVSILVNLEWPFGTLGDLVVNSGQTVYLNTSQSYDYNSIWVKSGGNLIINQISGKELEPVYLGAVNSIVIDGNLTSQLYYNEQGTVNYNAPDNRTITYSSFLSRGGNGGVSSCGFSSGGGGGAPYGGGGGGVYGAGTGYTGGFIYGGTGGYTGDCASYFNLIWVGGSGGSLGISGGIIYLKTFGKISGQGNIYLYGNAGSSGSSAYNKCGSAGAAGGGGGGGGGNGGKLFYHSQDSLITVTNINLNFGSGGTGGPNGGYGCNNGFYGSYGTYGSNGNAGILQYLP